MAASTPSCQEKKILERLALIKEAKALTTDLAILRPMALRVKLLTQQLKSLLPFIAEYERRIAAIFGSHPDRFLFKICREPGLHWLHDC